MEVAEQLAKLESVLLKIVVFFAGWDDFTLKYFGPIWNLFQKEFGEQKKRFKNEKSILKFGEQKNAFKNEEP